MNISIPHDERQVYVCEICHDNDVSKSLSSRKKKYYCASCINFSLLKLKLKTLTTVYYNSRAGHEVGQVLEDCLDNNASVSLKKYLNGSEDRRNDKDQLLGKLVPSIDSVARLAYVLLNVENIEQKKRLDRLKEMVEEQTTSNKLMRDKISDLRRQLEEKRQCINEKTKQLNAEHKESLSQVASSFEETNHMVFRQRALVDSAKLDLMADIIKLWNIQLLRASSGISVSILGLPVLSIDKLIYCSVPLINACMERLMWFVLLGAKYLSLQLPFCLILEDGWPKIVWNGTTYSVSLPLTSKRIGEPLGSLMEVNQGQLKRFALSLAMVIADLIRVVNTVDPSFSLQSSSGLRMSNFMHTDEMVAVILKQLEWLKDRRRLIREEKHAQSRQLLLLKRMLGDRLSPKPSIWLFWRKHGAMNAAQDTAQNHSTLAPIKTVYDPLCDMLMRTQKVSLIDRLSKTAWNDDLANSMKSIASLVYLQEDIRVLGNSLYNYIVSEIVKAVESYSMINTTTLMDSSTSSGYQQISIPQLRHSDSSAVMRKHALQTNRKVANKASNDNWEMIGDNNI
ncbi:hypothetical protein FOA43_003424 [Brettanomyces nanus]|uniref:Autophagy-related protein 14 n=1 Tax=Eeniella nana TaxID=13502 RepID=A0A875S504_EENNA|nr:uncharacterized protein FOA43_003424 [Brettanomyces nanus]QPG76038.1 hypothetical protein FOA43_003424 [Brettanomyces nanus]